MPRRSVISLLPPATRKQLDARLLASQFGDLANITVWLQKRGHKVGKSALGVYALQRRHQVEAETTKSSGPGTAAPEPAINLPALRLGCLHVAAQTGPATGLLRRASAYAKWVLQTGKDDGAK